MLSKHLLKSLRFKAKEKFSKAREIFFPYQESLEQSTPEKVSEYRAKRLSCNSIADLSCGIGSDAIALSKTCKKVFAIEKNAVILEAAKQNSKVFGVKNIEFILADCFSLDLKKLNLDAVFADPSRRVHGKRVKALNESMPNTEKLVEKILSSGIKNFCIEVSRDLKIEEISWNCEKEFISLNNELNCITLYFGELKKSEISIISLPSSERLESSTEKNSVKKSELLSYFFELDEAVFKSGLQAELLAKLENCYSFNEQFFTSANSIDSAFFKNSFKLLVIVEEKNLITELKKFNAGKIVLRGKILEKDFFNEKKKIEFQLTGSKKLHIFYDLIPKKIVVAENVEFN